MVKVSDIDLQVTGSILLDRMLSSNKSEQVVHVHSAHNNSAFHHLCVGK